MNTKITIADLFPHDEGMILVAKDAVDGSRRHISEVANGLACGCKCFGCNRQLIARNGGEVRAHSFAHRPEDMVYDCTTAGETALHIRAKEIIAQHCRITLPATSVVGLDGNTIEVTPERSVELTDVRLEMVAGELIPDVTATMPDGRRIFIEIANTHLCPPSKIEKLDAMGVEVLEITVSAYRAVPLDELDGIILDLAPRKLIHSSEVKAKAAEIAEQRDRREKAELADALRLVDGYRDQFIRNHLKAQAIVEDFIGLGLSEFLDVEDDRPSAFIIFRRQWQAIILDRLHREKSKLLTPMDFVRSFGSAKLTKEEIAYLKSDRSKWIASKVYEDFRSPYEEVNAYMIRLRKAGAVREISGKRFGMEHDFRTRIDAAIDKRDLPGRQRKEVRDLYEEIGTMIPAGDERPPAFESWIEARAEILGMTVEELVADEDGDFYELVDQLEAVKTMIIDMGKRWNVEPPEELVGLPLDGVINRHRDESLEALHRAEAEQAARQMRQETARNERLRQEAVDRVRRAEEQAAFVVRDTTVFMDRPLPEHQAKTRRELAHESAAGLAIVQADLEQIRGDERNAVAAEKLHTEMVGKLWDRVYSRIPDRARADVWPTQRWPELGGVKPIDYCRDKKTLDRCLEFLEEWVKTEQRRGRR